MTIGIMLRADPAEEQLLSNRVTDAIARHRKLLLLFVACLYIFSFNGKWRVGNDSALYRGLALNVASGNGYAFGDWAPRQVYPGFPYMLAAVEWLFGPSDRAPGLNEQRRLIGPSAATTVSVLLILACAAMTLVFTYKLIALYYPTWVAVTITCGVGTNSIFLKKSQEFLTDVPFLLGVVTALYGWELLRRASTRGDYVRAIAAAVCGLVLAAMLRPTFWILALAWAATCVWGLIRGPRRASAIALVILLAIWSIMLAMNPRGYEHEAFDVVVEAPQRFGAQLYDVLRNQFPAGFFGEQLAPFSVVASLLVLGSTLLLLRRHMLWALMVAGTFAVTLFLSAEPRYFMMVLPALLLGWLVLACRVARRFSRRTGEVILVLALSIVTCNNLSASVSFFIEQRRGDFIEHYKKGEYVPAIEMAGVLRRHVRPDQRVLGPYGAIMSLFSGVHVVTQREILPRGPGPHSPDVLSKEKLDYAIFPGSPYRDKEPTIARMMNLRILLPLKVVAHGPKGWYLATLHVTVPETDWRRLPRGWRPPPQVAATRPAPRPPRPAATRPARRRPATSPATRPAARPATRPVTRPAAVADDPIPGIARNYDFRAMTTMLSPLLPAESVAVLSGVAVYGGSEAIREAARATWGSTSSPVRIVSFFRPKYAPTAGRSSRAPRSALTARSRGDRGVSTLP